MSIKNLSKIFVAFGLVLSMSVPAIAGAVSRYTFPAGGTFIDVIFWLLYLINDIAIPGIIGLAIVAFLWGVANSIQQGADPKARTEGAKFILYGIIGLAIMLSFWGLVQFVLRSFGLNPQGFNAVQIQQGGSLQSAEQSVFDAKIKAKDIQIQQNQQNSECNQMPGGCN